MTLSNPLKMDHRNKKTLGDYQSMLKLIYSQYTLAIKGLSELFDIFIEYPKNTMLGVCKALKIGKKLCMKAIDLFVNQYGDKSCTAHELYYGINEVVFMVQCEGANGTRIADMEEKVAGALSINWKKYDMPGDLKW